MKIKPTWQFFAILAIAFCLGGVHTMLVVLVCMLALLEFYLFGLLLTFEERAKLLAGGAISAGSRVVRLLCKLGLHTRGEVVRIIPVTELAKQRLRDGTMFEQRAGFSWCVCCHKELFVSTFVYFDEKGKPRWFLDKHDLCKDIIALNRS